MKVHSIPMSTPIPKIKEKLIEMEATLDWLLVNDLRAPTMARYHLVKILDLFKKLQESL